MSTIGTQLDAALSAVGAQGPQGPIGPTGPVGPPGAAGPPGAPGIPDTTLDARLTALESTVRGIVSLPMIQEAFSGSAALPANATQLVITQQPTNLNSGSVFSPVITVEIRDAGSVKVAGATNAVGCTVTTGDASWRLTNNQHINAVNGVATFTLLTAGGKTGSYVLTFTSAGLTSAVSASFTITQVATKLFVTKQPALAQTAVAMVNQPIVEVEDAAGILMFGDTRVVTVALLSGPSALSGTLTATCVNGTATFSGLTLSSPLSPPTNVLQFTATGVTSVNAQGVDCVAAIAGVAPTFPSLNALAGMTVLNSTNFTGASAGLARQSGTTDYAWNGTVDVARNFVRTLTDSPADTTTAMVYNYPVGGLGGGAGTAPANGYPNMPGQLRLTYAATQREVGVGYILRFRSPYQSNFPAASNKLHWHGGYTGGQVWNLAYGFIGPSPTNRNSALLNPCTCVEGMGEMDTLYAAGLMASNNNTSTDTAGYRGAGCTDVSYVTDKWYRIESRMRMSSSVSAFDGIMQLWVSTWSGSAWSAPVLAINRQDLRMNADTTGGGPMLGSSNMEFMHGGGGRIGYDNDNQNAAPVGTVVGTVTTAVNSKYVTGSGTRFLTDPQDVTQGLFLTIGGVQKTIATLSLQGTISTTGTNATITGSGTAFQTDLAVGAVVQAAGVTFTILSITSNLLATATATVAAIAGGSTATVNAISSDTLLCTDSAWVAASSGVSATWTDQASGNVGFGVDVTPFRVPPSGAYWNRPINSTSTDVNGVSLPGTQTQNEIELKHIYVVGRTT